MNDALQFLSWKEVNIGDRIIILGMDQTTHEYQEWGWRNINGIYLKGERGQDWLDWKSGRDAKEVDAVTLFNQLYEKLKLDEAFAKKVKGEKWEEGKRWEKWEDFIPDIAIIVEILISKLINYPPFIDKIKGKDGKNGKDGEQGLPGKDWTNWTNWENGEPGMDWRDGRSVVMIENTENIELFDKELGIDMNKNIYLKHNWTILKL